MITWNELPKEIQDKMLEHQVAQGNGRNPEVFICNTTLNKKEKGFSWDVTPEGYGFWYKILNDNNINHFYTHYPKQIYPKVMMVSYYPITNSNPGLKRVVFMEKCSKYIAWSDVETLEEAEKKLSCMSWDYAKDIEPENKEKQELLAKADELIKKAEELKEMASKL